MSQASVEGDAQFARSLSRIWNANPRRASALQAIPQMSGPMETPMPNRIISFKSPMTILPMTPISMASTPIEARTNGFETSSSSISSLQGSAESSSNETPPSMMLRSRKAYHRVFGAKPVSLVYSLCTIIAVFDSFLPGTVGLQWIFKVQMLANIAVAIAPQGRKPRGLTSVSIGEADARSNPPPGPELLGKVDSAKASGEVPILYDSSVVRYVDGKWMAPQMCNRSVSMLNAAECSTDTS